MKKIFLMLLGIAATINVMAVDYTAKAKVRVSSTTGFYCDLMLSESAEYGSLTGSPIYLPGYQVALYVINGTDQLQIARANSLNDVQLALKTDDGTDYTFTVSSVAGDETLYFMDAQGENHALTEGASFTIVGLTANTTIEGRFTLGRPSAPVVSGYNVTLNANGLATFSADDVNGKAKLPAGVKAYTAEFASLNDALILHEITSAGDIVLPVGEGVFLYGTPGAIVLPFTDEAATSLPDNQMKAASAFASLKAANDIYFLHGSEMWQYTGDEFAANKAFLPVAKGSGAPARIRLVFDQATAIDAVEAEAVKAEKFVENGQIFIRRGNEVFNLQGQIVK